MGTRINIDSGNLPEDLRDAPKILRGEIIKSAKEALVEVQREARRTHRFVTRSSGLNRSMTVSKIDNQDMSGEVFLNTGVAIYGPRIHRGFGTWQPDRFLYKAAAKMKPKVYKILSQAFSRALVKARLKK